MPLWANPPHSVDIYLANAPTEDDGGGTTLNWPSTPSQAGCPCSIATLSASTITRYAQAGITVSHQIGILTAALSVQLQRGTKYIVPDTGATYIQVGLRSPDRAYGTIPMLTYINVIQQL